MRVSRIPELSATCGSSLDCGPKLPYRSEITMRDAPGSTRVSRSQSITGEARTPLLSSILIFARSRYYWSPARLVRLFRGVTADIPRQIELFRLMSLPAFSDLHRTEPRFRFKFLIRDYLVRGFSITQSTACFLHHYKRLHATMSEDLLHRTLHQSVVLLEATQDGMHRAISLCYSRPFEKEGELSLNLHVDGAVVFVLSFTIVPGWAVQCEAEEALLVSRLQGTNGYYPHIRAATKSMHNVGPAALLLAALQGFAKAFGIRWMAGVSAIHQSSYTERLSLFYKNAYDDFFSEIGIPCNPAGFFLSTLPPQDKPMSLIKQGHKIRTKEKRQFKSQVAEHVCRLLRRELKVRNAEASAEEDTDPVAEVFHS